MLKSLRELKRELKGDYKGQFHNPREYQRLNIAICIETNQFK